MSASHIQTSLLICSSLPPYHVVVFQATRDLVDQLVGQRDDVPLGEGEGWREGGKEREREGEVSG